MPTAATELPPAAKDEKPDCVANCAVEVAFSDVTLPAGVYGGRLAVARVIWSVVVLTTPRVVGSAPK